MIDFITAGFPGWATGGPSAEVIGLPMGPGLRMDPYFVEDQPTSKNITVLAGQKAYLECRVRNLGAKRVSYLSFTVHKYYISLSYFNRQNIIIKKWDSYYFLRLSS